MMRAGIHAIAFASLAAAFLGGASGAIAASRCQQWDVGGKWVFLQSGARYGFFDVRQKGDLLEGTATSYYGSYEKKPGVVDGVINGSTIEMTVYWNSDLIGIYRGKIKDSGRIEGVTFDKLHPKKRAVWYSSERMKCVTAANAPPPAAPPAPSKGKIKVLGKKKIDPSPAKDKGDPARCAQGFVWRVARPDDLVCVTPEARSRTAEENRRAGSRRDPNGAYGPRSCISGYVWREAFDGDTVCVTPETRTLVREENRQAASRRAGG